ncbi:shikimate dehydrogenase [Halolactibacillus halophilus]|uniref:Shikimate dehydrogenase (NADP(+)) n=1 Tax=Halolactibacillus halophilus TaxID=306540 RepID=A0A1I5KWG3_9BACI|nr:shikimate dehydrogenase [Halolactibacillus halophilus]GEM00533.1 shikimate dehydrogenase (NADP(+)) [Halolactibacillus halophilus]SFO89303.1 shikimate dehydrogenase [Halolactibacillus halophilus]
MRFFLIGYPLGHSMSPFLHGLFLDQIGQRGTYELKELIPETFNDQIRALKQSGYSGFNITIPYKVDIMPFLDVIDPQAKAIGAVNTVVIKDGCWTGYNTDGAGYVQSLKYHYPQLFRPSSRFLVLGAGGASRGIVHALNNETCAAITISNRTVEKAATIINALPPKKDYQAISFSEAEATLDQYDAIINTTSLGMEPNVDTQAIHLNRLKQGAVVSDIVYKPFVTALIREAMSKGADVHHGHEMLVYQAALAFELWTGYNVDARPVIEAFETKLKL